MVILVLLLIQLYTLYPKYGDIILGRYTYCRDSDEDGDSSMISENNISIVAKQLK